MILILGTLTGLHAAEDAAQPAADWAAVRQATFTEVWQTVNDSYFDPKFGGVDWAAVGAKYRALLDRAKNQEELRRLLQTMLNELHRTHFAIVPREAAVFRPAERTKVGTVGLEVAWIQDQVVIDRVTPGSPASRDGVQPGDALVKIGPARLETVKAALERAGMGGAREGAYLCAFAASRLHPPVGSKVALELVGLDGTKRSLALISALYSGPWSEPIGAFPAQPLDSLMRRNRDGVAYLRFNVFSPQLMKGLRHFLLGLNRPGADDPAPARGLVIDLRGNPGGLSIMGSGLAGWLCRQSISLGHMRLRQGFMNFDVFPQSGAFTGPVAVLIDSCSASTSELMAVGLQEAGRARVFGEPSAGAALPSAFKTLPTGDILQYAIADLETPKGVMLEGHGVEPDTPVTCTRADLAAGRDPVLAAAESWLQGPAQQPAGD